MENLVKIVFVALLVVVSSFGLQHQYKIFTENLTANYVDPKYLHLNCGVYAFNEENCLNVSFKLKIDVPANTKVSTKALKWFTGDYRVQVFQIDKTAKDIIEMESFDLQSLWVDHSRPPVVWPIEKGVIYRLEGWIPDSSQYPPNMPDGQWKVRMDVVLPNKTKMLELSWFINVKYFK